MLSHEGDDEYALSPNACKKRVVLHRLHNVIFFSINGSRWNLVEFDISYINLHILCDNT